MRQKSNSNALSSEEMVKGIRRATRKRYSAEEKIRIVLDGLDAKGYNVPHQLVEQVYEDTGMRTAPLRGVWQHAPYFHNGTAPTLDVAVRIYNARNSLGLTEAQIADLTQYLKSP